MDKDKWWELTLARGWQIEQSRKLVSTYFGDAGSFAWDGTGNFVVVQGFGWLFRNEPDNVDKIGLAYLTILTSDLFSELLSSVSNNVSGGQRNLSSRFVNQIPIPDFFNKKAYNSLFNDLANLGKLIHAGSFDKWEDLNELVYLAYGIQKE